MIDDIKGWEGQFAITSDGKVWHHAQIREVGSRWGGKVIRHDKGHWMTLNNTRNGDWYYSISFGVGKKRRGYKVHRLVAQAFIPNPNNLPDVNHKNGKKGDNRIENLEWCTRQYNIDHSFTFYPAKDRPLQRGEQTAAHKLTEKQVKEIKKELKKGKTTMRQIAIRYGVAAPTIQGINRGWYWAWVH